MIKENTASDASTPMKLDTESVHRELEAEEPDYGSANEYEQGFPPETVTADFLVNRSRRSGAKCLITTLIRLVPPERYAPMK